LSREAPFDRARESAGRSLVSQDAKKVEAQTACDRRTNAWLRDSTCRFDWQIM
jgi:hypothetical protein